MTLVVLLFSWLSLVFVSFLPLLCFPLCGAAFSLSLGGADVATSLFCLFGSFVCLFCLFVLLVLLLLFPFSVHEDKATAREQNN